jgi:LacI family transcriptional regulator
MSIVGILVLLDTPMNHNRPKPNSAQELISALGDGDAEFGKGTRRLANFIAANPEDTVLLTSAEVAEKCGVHASSVVRLAQGLGFSGYRELQLLLRKDKSFIGPNANPAKDKKSNITLAISGLRLSLLGESGKSFNDAAEAAAQRYCQAHSGVTIKSDFHLPHNVDPNHFAEQIETAAEESNGIILVAREHPAINGAVRSAIARGVPVICLTSDLQSSPRTAYVGSDQFASGTMAGYLCGRMLPHKTAGQVLLVYSVPFRCQLEREQGFRQILRTEFPALAINEKVSSNESIEITYNAVRKHITKFGPPTAIYNVSGGNTGIGRALEDEGLALKTIFIGHELNNNSRALLERGTMDFAIGHDFDREIELAVDAISMALQGQQPVKQLTQSQLFTRFNCAIL